MSAQCVHTFDDGTQCPHVDWCPIHGDVNRYEPPATPMGLYGAASRPVTADQPCSACPFAGCGCRFQNGEK